MSFTSWQFVVFATVIFLGYYLAPVRQGWGVLWLVAGSIFFYAWDQWRLLPLLVGTVLGTYGCLVLSRRGWRGGVALGVAFNLAVLAFFKYKFLFALPAPGAAPPAGPWAWLLALPLPIGISFFVFHNISLLVDFTRAPSARTPVSRETPLPRLRELFLYISFFPQLISGPITRARSFFPQIGRKEWREIDWVTAARWIVSGYFMKLFCANNLSQFTSFMEPPHFQALSGADRALLLVLYSFQIYADFFGYSAIAVGLGLLFGYRLPVNFRRPYLASSFADFWARWHISLSTWLRHYLYIPLGGNRAGRARTYLNLMLVMGLGGLWHGAGLSYLLWGLAHGSFLVAERPFLAVEERWRLRLPAALSRAFVAARVALVFALVSVAWVFFKLPHFADALSYLQGLARGGFAPGFSTGFYVLAALYSLPIVLQHLGHRVVRQGWFRRVEPAFYAVLIFLATVEAGPETVFIYFQF